MDSVRRARHRLKQYPRLISSCSYEATIYAKCVARYMGEVGKDQCREEFTLFKECVKNAAKKAGTKL